MTVIEHKDLDPSSALARVLVARETIGESRRHAAWRYDWPLSGKSTAAVYDAKGRIVPGLTSSPRRRVA